MNMYYRISKLTIGLMFAVLIASLWITPAFAQAGSGQWMTVSGSEPYWFSFRVGRSADNDELQRAVSIGSYAKPAGGATFQVFGGGDWNMWDSYDQGGWIGEGYAVDNGPYTWSGDLVPGTYFIRMQPTGTREVRLAVSGEGVDSFQSLDHSTAVDFIVDVQQPEVAAAAQTVAAQPSQSPAALGATFTVAEPQPLAVVEPELEMSARLDVDDSMPMWYTFSVGHVEDEDQNSSSVSISMLPEPWSGQGFQIYNGANAHSWADPSDGDLWFGAGASNDNGSYSWSGQLIPGTYFVRVDAQGTNTYQLAISGEAVQY